MCEDVTLEEGALSFDLCHPQPLLIVVSGPSGVGKDAALRALQQRGFPLHFVVTMTSRLPRRNEVEGVDYLFVSREHFEELIEKQEFVEYAVVYEDYKGVPKSQIRDAMESGDDVILRVDVQGAQTLRGLCPEAVLIFLIPDNQKEWLDRLRKRATETEESLKVRMKTAARELEYLDLFDYVVVNAHDQLDETVDTLGAILTAEHHRVHPRRVTL